MSGQDGEQSLQDGDASERDAALIASSNWFDADWYSATYPAARSSGLLPHLHYLRDGTATGYDPGPRFGTTAYLAAHVDVAASGLNPLVHYLCYGIAERRQLTKAGAATSEPASTSPNAADIDSLARSGWFDRDWYLSCYLDVSAAGADPVLHYLEHGAAEGRDPGPLFSTTGYLAAHSDVSRAGENPLLHYIHHGQAEGRRRTDDYPRWIAECERLTGGDRLAIAEHIRLMAPTPTISVLVPTFNTPESSLIDTILSVKRQLYPHWELCIADDCSPLPHVRATLAGFARNDSRIRVVERDRNGGIAAATNSALALATGDWLALLDHDDLLPETALYEVAAEIARTPDVTLLFSDSDEIDDAGNRSNPYFKPGWNCEVMLAQNLVSHLGVYRRDLVERLGGVREGFEGSQDYDLALRVIDASQPAQIRHIPAVLYHWRRSGTPISFSDRHRDTCVQSARRAVAEHLARNGVDARVEANPLHPMWARIVHPLPASRPRVTMILPVIGEAGGLVAAFDDLRARTSYPGLQFVMVADERIGEAGEQALAALEGRPSVRVVRQRASLTPVAAVQAGLDASGNSEVVVLAEPGLRVLSSPLWLDELVSHVARPGVAAAGPKVRLGGGILDPAGTGLGPTNGHEATDARVPGYFGLLSVAREVATLGPGALALRRSAVVEAGGLDNGSPSLAAAVADLCRRLRAAGDRLVWTPFAVVERHRPAKPPTGHDGHHGHDPFHNPNVAPGTLDTPAFPGRRCKPWAAIKARLDIREGQAARARTLLRGVDPQARLLEIGASYNPIAPRAEGWRTTVIDHAPQDELIAKYTGEPDVWTDRIEDVDFIWTGGSVADAVPAELHGSFDVLVASHMIEHSTDLLGFLQGAERLLGPEGTVILAVPDKRYCFDYFRPLTTTADVVEAHRDGRTRHGWRTGFEHLAYAVLNEGKGAWGQEPVGSLRFADGFGDAICKLDERFLRDTYVDFHAWKFTPAGFELILLETCALGLCDWMVEAPIETLGCEFHVRLRRGGGKAVRGMTAAALDAARMELLRRTLAEMRQQLDWALSDRLAETVAGARPEPPDAVRGSAAGSPGLAEVPVPLGYRPDVLMRPPRLAVVLHLFHTDLGAELRTALEAIPCPFDIFVSTTDELRADAVRTAFKGWRRGSVTARVFPNRGRDIAPKLVGFRDIYDDYSLVLFLHSKKSSHSPLLKGWRQHLLSCLAGSPARVEGVLEMFERRPTLGIIGAPHYGPVAQSIGWGPNFAAAQALAERVGFALDRASPMDMPAGSMFWARTAALAPLRRLELSFDDFPLESGQLDGTLAHAVERLFYHACEYAGFEWVKVGAPGADMPPLIRTPAELDDAIRRAISPLGVARAADEARPSCRA